jgi:mono/diheme cytochrome c family protein
MRNCLVFLTSAVLAASAWAQAKKEPGVAVTFHAGGKSDTRTERFIALYVPKGSAPTSFLPAGPFTATFKSEIQSSLRSEYTFIVEVRGQVKVSINGQVILDAAGAAAAQYADKTLQLNKGANPVVVEYKTDGEDDAQLRLDWSSKEFPREPIPASVWTHVVEPAEATGQQLREGRMLFATHHCTACHDAGDLVPKDGTGMSELLATAPDLIEAGARFRPEWLAAWIANPREQRAKTTMPHLPLTKEQAGHIAAYLASLGKPAEAKLDPEKASTGGGLFGSLGCISCHTQPDYSGNDEHARISLSHVKGKFQTAALIEFLKMPGMHNPFTRMPNFRLTDEDAGAIASYLIGTSSKEFTAVPGDIAKGKELATSTGCASCHAGLEPSTLKAPGLAAVLKAPDKGCVAEKPEKAPDFSWKPDQRAALSAFLQTGLGSLKQDNVTEYATRQVKYLNCTACHGMDGNPSVFQQLEEEVTALTAGAPQPEHPVEGATVPPTAIPHLTWFGEKLQTGYMSAMIAGAQGFKPRPWLASRMPGFGGPGGGIANGLAHQHGFPLVDLPPESEPAKESVETGHKLAGADGGFNCIQCHGVKDQPATSVFEAPGINLAYSAQRLRKTYYHRWMLSPLRVDPETKMPKFSEDHQTTQLTDVLEGKAPAQFEAIWQYLRSVK